MLDNVPVNFLKSFHELANIAFSSEHAIAISGHEITIKGISIDKEKHDLFHIMKNHLKDLCYSDCPEGLADAIALFIKHAPISKKCFSKVLEKATQIINIENPPFRIEADNIEREEARKILKLFINHSGNFVSFDFESRLDSLENFSPIEYVKKHDDQEIIQWMEKRKN